MTEPDTFETGTTTVGVVADDADELGVVVAADRRASLGGRFVANRDAVKVEQVHPTAAVTIAGSVGAGQAFVRGLRARADLYETRRDRPMSVEALATAAGGLVRGRRLQPLLAGVDDDGARLFSIDTSGGVMEAPVAATGSGMQLAHGVLERRAPADLDDAADAARAAVAAASERDVASGDGIRLARITAEGVTVDDDPSADGSGGETAGGEA